MKSNKTAERLIFACLRAVAEEGAPCSVGLSRLEYHYNGPASGAAGGVVRRWPKEGIVSSGFRFTFERVGDQSRVRVERDEVLTRYLTPDEKRALADFPSNDMLAVDSLKSAGFVEDCGLTDLGMRARDEVIRGGR